MPVIRGAPTSSAGRTETSERLNPMPTPTAGIGSVLTGTASDVTRQGTWAYAKPSHGPRYLAIPEGRGWLVMVCGPADCFLRVSTDAGPVLSLQRAGRIGDLSAVDFERACGVSTSFGLCSGSYTIQRRPSVTLPPTSTEGSD